MWEPRQGVRGILRTVSALPPKKIVHPGLALLVVHVASPCRQISGMEVGEEWKVVDLNVSVLSVFCLGAGGVCGL